MPSDTLQQRSFRTSSDVTGTRIAGLAFASWTLWCLGYPDRALEHMHDTLVLAQDFSHPFTLAFIQGYAALLHQSRREGHSAQERAEAAIAVSNEQGFPFWLAWGTILRGWALAAQDQIEEGVASMQQGLAAYRATGAAFHLPWLLPLLVEMHGRMGQLEEGLTLLAEALTAVDNAGGHQWEAELRRLKGELLLALSTGNQAEAETCFCQALAIARRQEAKSLELRAAMSLSRLWQEQGKRDEARALLVPIYNWFTEGFDTADLQEAKALLDALGG